MGSVRWGYGASCRWCLLDSTPPRAGPVGSDSAPLLAILSPVPLFLRSLLFPIDTPMPNPLVSFVVPCYKLAHLLPECIQSILSQSYTDFEVLVMDDCSPDNTSEVAKSFR